MAWLLHAIPAISASKDGGQLVNEFFTYSLKDHKVKYDRPGVCSPEKDCLRWHWLTFRQPERKSSSESKDFGNANIANIANNLLTNKLTNYIYDRSFYSIYWRYTNHLTLKMTSAQVVGTSVNVISNSPSQDYTHPDDRTLLYDVLFYQASVKIKLSTLSVHFYTTFLVSFTEECLACVPQCLLRTF